MLGAHPAQRFVMTCNSALVEKVSQPRGEVVQVRRRAGETQPFLPYRQLHEGRKQTINTKQYHKYSGLGAMALITEARRRRSLHTRQCNEPRPSV